MTWIPIDQHAAEIEDDGVNGAVAHPLEPSCSSLDDVPSDRPLTVAIRVAPASSRTVVGGRRGDALVVRVTQPAVDGRATEAALAAVADALGVRRGKVRLVRGATSRDKVLAVDNPDGDLGHRLLELMEQQAGSSPPNR